MWWAAVPKAYCPEDAESLKSIDDDWDPEVGDARQELVLIGIDMDEGALRARLDACLLKDSEMAQGPPSVGTLFLRGTRTLRTRNKLPGA